ncbi:MAG: hypothetical protein PHV63_02595 [Candidatus Daviesbacteria bacterium]|nr:hypothetical protein [Candidatus Daviesbacteria bacterium]
MAGPAPTGVLQHIKAQDNNWHENVADNLTKAGHPTTAADVNPDDNSPLKGIEEAWGDTVHVVGSAVDEQVGGAGDNARIRTAQSKIPRAIDFIRRRLMKKAA